MTPGATDGAHHQSASLRNLHRDQKSYPVGNRYEEEKKATPAESLGLGGEVRKDVGDNDSQKPCHTSKKTAEKIAKEEGQASQLGRDFGSELVADRALITVTP